MSQTTIKTKRNIKAFLVSEEGKISKEALLKTGVFLTGAAVSAILSTHPAQAAHSNNLGISYANNQATATHTHSTATGTATATATATATGTGTGTYY